MNPKRLQFIISLVLLLLIAFQVFHYYPLLPKFMPGKYNASGQPVSMMSKEAFVGVFVGTYLLLFFVFAVIGVLAHKLPPSMINIPNREYWFSPEHHTEGCERLALMMLRFSNITSLFMIVLFQFILDQVMTNVPFGHKFWILLGAYLIYTFVWCVQLWIKFKKPAEA